MSLDTWVMDRGWRMLDRFEPAEFLDRLQQLGARNLAIGQSIPAVPDPAHYRDSPVQPEPPSEAALAYAPRVRAFFGEAQRRGVAIYLYGTNPHSNGQPEVYRRLPQKSWLAPAAPGTAGASGSRDRFAPQPVESYWGACASGDAFLPYYLGRIRDALAFWPDTAGMLKDGPEFGYEIVPGFMGGNWDLFTCFAPCCAARAARLGYDWPELVDAATHLRRWLASIDAAALEEVLDAVESSAAPPNSSEGAAAEAEPGELLARACGSAGVAGWLRFRADAVDHHLREVTRAIRAEFPRLRIGIGSRTAAFAPLTGYDLQRVARHADFCLPKLYVWMAGYDGLYGTVHRWAVQLRAWNPDVPEPLLLRFLWALFGLTLPGVAGAADMERYASDDVLVPRGATHGGTTHEGASFPDAFFARVVAAEAARAIARVGDANRVRPWVGTSHGGRVLTPRELDLLLHGAEQGGLTTYLYYAGLEGDEWDVARRHARI
jgi:hypothetical protein